MIKNLRKFMMLLMTLVSVSAFAQEVEVIFDFKGNPWGATTGTGMTRTNNLTDGLTTDGVHMATTVNSSGTYPGLVADKYLQMGQGSTLTITAPSGYAIKSILYNVYLSKSYNGTPEFSTGSYEAVTKTLTWTADEGNEPNVLVQTITGKSGAYYEKATLTLVPSTNGGGSTPTTKETKSFDITEVTNAGNAAGTVKEWVNSYVVTVPEGTEFKGNAGDITLNIPEFSGAYKCQGVNVVGTAATLSFANVLDNAIVDGAYKLNIPANVFAYETETEIYKNNAYTATWTLSNAPKTPVLGNLGWNVKYGMQYKAEDLAAEGVQVTVSTDDAKEAAMQNLLYVEAVLSGINLMDEGYTTVANGIYKFEMPMGAENPTAKMFADAFAGETIFDSYRVEVKTIIFGERGYDEVSDKEVFTKIYHTFADAELDAINPTPMAFDIDKSTPSGGDDSVIGTPKAVYKNGAVYIQFEGAKFSEVCNDPNGWYDFTISGHTIDGNIEYYAAYEMDPAKYNEVQVSQDGTVLAEGEHTLVIPAGQFMIAYTDPTTWASQTLYQNAEDIVITFTVGGEEPSGDAVTVTAEVADGLTKIYVTYNNYKNADGGDNNIDLTNLSTYAMYSAEPWGTIDDSNNTVEYRIYEALPAGNYEVVINQGAAFVSNSNITYDESEYNQAATASLEIKAQGGGNEGNEGDVPTHDTILTAGGVEIVDGGSYAAADVASWTVKTVGEAKTGYMFVAKLFGGKMQSDPDMGSYWVEGSDEYVADVVVDNNHQFTATFATTIPAGQYRLLCRMVNTTTWDWVVDTELYITVSNATSINAINEAVKNAVKFNLSGQRVNNAKGIVIMNGKKVMVK